VSVSVGACLVTARDEYRIVGIDRRMASPMISERDGVAMERECENAQLTETAPFHHETITIVSNRR